MDASLDTVNERALSTLKPKCFLSQNFISGSWTPAAMDDESLDTIIEVREELMVSPSSGGNPTKRIAHFLKPTMNCSLVKEPAFDFLLPHSLVSGTLTSSNVGKLPLEVTYNGWLHPQKQWKAWVELMQAKYEHVWVQAGIHQAIKASTCTINRNSELILALAERWYCKTNTFIFPWGEATITLEDIKVCGGFSVVGAPVFRPLETKEQKESEAKLVAVRRMFFKSKARRADHFPWMMHFMRSGSQVEHEAFLSLWLSRFVFPSTSHRAILKCVFPIAIHLARGTRIALAPAVLASIYRDLNLLNKSINSATKMKMGVTVWAPFQLVLVWALERFPALQPQPNLVDQSQPRMARWHRVNMLNNNNKLKLTLDSGGARNCFLWCPYENSPSLKLYNEKDMWVCDSPNLHDELDSYVRCLRVSKLVGMDCIEQYFPNRVAMQFGMDQDIPGMVARCNKDPWIDYSQPVMDTNLCTALCARQPNATSRYYDWWKQSKIGKEESTKMGSDNRAIILSSYEYLSQDSSRQVEGDRSYGSPNSLPSKRKRDQVGDSDQGDELAIIERFSSSSKYRCFEVEVVGNKSSLSSPESSTLPSLSVVYQTSGLMTGGVYNFGISKDVLRGSKRAIEDLKIKDVVGGERIFKEDANEAKPKTPFCDTNGVNMEEKGASHCVVEIASYLEIRIQKLERVHAKLKAAKFGPKYKTIGSKAYSSGP